MKTEKLKSFQVYSQEGNVDLNLLVDKIWLENDRIYFRVIEILSRTKNHLRREKENSVYSIHEKNIFSIRCKLYLSNHQIILTK
ncbi:MAG: hypothetical protein ACFFBZ_04245 [Promethearchaeota archaeon]